MDHDSDTVIFPSIPMDMLSEDLQRVLKKELTNHPDTRFDVEHYVMARAFILGCQSNK